MDSTLLLKVYVDVLGKEGVLALIARSETYPEQEITEAVAFARSLGVAHEVIVTSEMEDESYLRNTKERCYHCKQHLFGRVRQIAAERGIDRVLEGVQRRRPGRLSARTEGRTGAGHRKPLFDGGPHESGYQGDLEKLGLPTHNKPSLACLASRIPYGTRG